MEEKLKEKWIGEDGKPKCFGQGYQFRRGKPDCQVLWYAGVCDEKMKEECYQKTAERREEEKLCQQFIKDNLFKCAATLIGEAVKLKVGNPFFWKESDRIAKECYQNIKEELINIDDYRFSKNDGFEVT